MSGDGAGELVRSPSAARETLGAAQLSLHVALWSLVVALGHGEASAGASVQAFEARFADLDAADQRVFRSLQEGLAEAEARRARSGAWPTVEELARAGVPPFARDPLDRAGYVWTRAATPTLVNYVGAPAAETSRPMFALVVQEPPPGAPVDPNAVVDEVHHKLRDGTLLHVATWMGPNATPPPRPLVAFDATRGYKQIVIGSTGK